MKKQQIIQFVAGIRASGESAHIQVRGAALSKELRVSELRTGKHDHLAVAWWRDGAYPTVLTSTGCILQLTERELVA